MSKQGLTSEPSHSRKLSFLNLFNSQGGRTHLFASVLASLVLAGLFFHCFASNRRLAFRDLGHFYEPLYRYLDVRSSETWFPLWGSLDQTGVPLAGDSTTALFYPFRLIFALPQSIESRIVWYCIIHLLIAGAGIFRLCRKQGYSIEACWCAAIGYCGSGAIFFLYCNPPFLVGASWLPWMFQSFVAASNDRTRIRWVIGVFAVAFAVLGGDPQTAYHSFLLATGVLVVRSVRQIRRSSFKNAIRQECLPQIQWIGSIALVSCLIAFPQIAPSWQWSQLSWRAKTAMPSLWSQEQADSHRLIEAGSELLESDTANGDSSKDRVSWSLHSEAMFDFSIAPWHLIELVWPYCSGKMAPENQRWFDALEDEPRTWTPTIYMGLLSAISLIVAAIRFRALDLYSGTFLFALLCTLGGFGMGFLWRAVTDFDSGASSVEDDAFGGLYWVLAKCVPGYNLFRYPAKWLSLLALSSSIITAKFISESESDGRSLGMRAFGILLGLSLLGFALTFLPELASKLGTFLATPRTVDRFWGPVSSESVLRTVRASTLHTSVAATAFWGVLKFGNPRLLIGIVLLDLGLVAHWMVLDTNRLPPSNNGISGALDGLDQRDFWPRSRVWLVASMPAWPNSWREQPGDDRRAEDVELAQRSTWFVRWHLADGIHVVNNQVSIPSAAYEGFRQSVIRRALASETGARSQIYSRVCDFLGCDIIATRKASGNDVERLPELAVRRLTPEPRTMTFHPQVRILQSRDSDIVGYDFDALVDEIFHFGPSRIPIVECLENTGTVHPFEVTKAVSDSNKERQFNVVFRKSEPEFTQVEIQTEVPGLLRWAQMQDGNWRCRYRTSPGSPWTEATSHSVDGVAQGVFVPAGNIEVVWEYCPKWWYPSWGMVLIGLLIISLSMQAFPSWPFRQYGDRI